MFEKHNTQEEAILEEALKKVANNTAETVEKRVTLCLRSRTTLLHGIWKWEMNSLAVYASDVMSFPEEFEGTKGIIHPEDLADLMDSVASMEEKEIPRFEFRIITTYGEIKRITGQRVSFTRSLLKLPEPLPTKERWEEALEQIVKQKEVDFLYLRKELAEHTERFYNIGSWMVNKTTAQAWYSDNVFRIYGLAPQSLNAHANTFNHFIHRDDREAVLDAFEKAYEKELPLTVEYRIALTGDVLHYVQQTTRWMYNNSGEIILCGIVRDVTEERRLADEVLAVQSKNGFHQEVLKLFQQRSNTAYWYIDLITKKASYSESYYRIYGFKHFSLPLNNSFLHLVHTDDRKKVKDAFDNMYRNKTMPEMEFRIVRADGKLRYLKQSAVLFTSVNKEEMMIGVVQDITIQRGLEKKIQELSETITLNEDINHLTEESFDISTITWLGDELMLWSESFHKLIGTKSGSDVSSRLLYKHIHPDDVNAFKKSEAAALKGEETKPVEIKLLAKNATKNVCITFRNLALEKKVVVGVVRDISKHTLLLQQHEHDIAFSKLLTDAVNDLIIFTNADNTILHWNEKATEKTGISKEEAIYHNLFDALPWLKTDAFLSQLNKSFGGENIRSFRTENAYLKKAHDFSLIPLTNENGEVTGILHIVQDVSKQLELQQQLSERLNFIESLLEASVDQIVVLDRFMNYLYWNKKAEEYYGIAKEKVIGKNILEVFPSFRNHVSYSEFRKVLKGETIHLTADINEGDGEYSETYLTPIKNESGEVTGVLWIVHDLTKEYELQREKRIAEEKIREQAHYLQRITETTPDMISIMELETKHLTFLNAQTFKAHGFDPEEMSNKPREQNTSIIHQDDREILHQYFQGFGNASDNDIISSEYRAKTKEGEWKWFLVRGKVFQRDENGNVTHILNVIENITARKHAEQELLRVKEEVSQKATDKYLSLFNSIGQGFCIVEVLFDENNVAVDYRFMEVNPSFEGQTGLRNSVGKQMSELAPDREPHWYGIYGEVATTGVAKHFEEKAEALGRWFDVYAFQIDAPEDHHVAILFNDITERKKTEEAYRIQLQREVENRTKELKESKELLKSVFDASLHGIMVLQAVRKGNEILDFEILLHNAVTYQWNGRDLTGKKYGEEFPAIRQNGLFDLLKRVVEVGEPINTELYYGEGHFKNWYQVTAVKTGEDQVVTTAEDITARKKSEEETLKQLTILQHTESLAQTGSWEYETTTGSFSWSEGMYKLFGRPQQMKVRPETYLDYSTEEDRSTARKIINFFKKKHESFEEILRIKRKDEVRIIKIKGSVVTDEKGKVSKIIGVDIDITNIKQAEEKLKESRHWLEETTKASPDSITVYDMQTKQPIYLNSCLAEWIGITNDDLVEMGIEGRLKLIHPDDRLHLLHTNEKTLAAKDGEVITMEYRVTTHDDKTIWLRNRSKPFLRNSSGKVTHILSILQNVTEEIELREELKRRTQFAEAILDASVDRITVFDQNYQFVGWNKRCEQIHRKTKGEVIGKTIFEMFPGVENHPEFMESQDRSLKGEFVHVPVVKDGFTGDYLELVYIPLKNEAGETYAVVNVMHDVSDYVLSTEALNILNKKLESKNSELEQKNEEITSFAFVASHDMKEPLRKIHTFADWLIEQEMGRLSDKGKNLIEKIDASVHRMEVLIDDILVLTKIHSDTHREEDVDLNRIVKQVMDEMADEIFQTRTVINASKLPLIKANANQVFYLFRNLISNAIKFQKPGSLPQLTITSEVIKGSEVSAIQPCEEYAKLSFIDNGFGFDQRYAKKIFQVFQRLHGKHEFEGTGIGLAICKKIMENHNGLITVESEQGKGSVFSCYFPLH